MQAKIKPKNVDPVSPIKIFAGFILKIRKATDAPMSVAALSAEGFVADAMMAVSGKGEDTMTMAIERLSSFLQKGDVVLLKGSRGMGLERITTALQSVVSGGDV